MAFIIPLMLDPTVSILVPIVPIQAYRSHNNSKLFFSHSGPDSSFSGLHQLPLDPIPATTIPILASVVCPMAPIQGLREIVAGRKFLLGGSC